MLLPKLPSPMKYSAQWQPLLISETLQKVRHGDLSTEMDYKFFLLSGNTFNFACVEGAADSIKEHIKAHQQYMRKLSRFTSSDSLCLRFNNGGASPLPGWNGISFSYSLGLKTNKGTKLLSLHHTYMNNKIWVLIIPLIL